MTLFPPDMAAAFEQFAYSKCRLESVGGPMNGVGQVGDAMMAAIAAQFPDDEAAIMRVVGEPDTYMIRERLVPLIDWARVKADVAAAMVLS